MKVAYLGPKGTYTEFALQKHTPDVERIPLDSISDVFEAVASGQYKGGFVPLQNKGDNRVSETVTCMFNCSKTVRIVGAMLYPTHHAIGVLPGYGKIEKILTKDTVFRQCSQYIKEYYPLAVKEEKNSTVAGMQEITEKQMKNAAAMGPKATLEDYGLDVLPTGYICNIEDNKTKFIALGHGDAKPTGKDVTSLIVHPREDRDGLLDEMTDIIYKEYKLGISFIDSDNDENGRLIFFIDLKGHLGEIKMVGCVQSMMQKLPDTEVYVLGSYPDIPF